MLWRELLSCLTKKSCSNQFHSPGAIYTPIQVDTKDPESMEGWGSDKQLGRPGQASEVATSFVFLASKDASFYCMFSGNCILTRLANT